MYASACFKKPKQEDLCVCTLPKIIHYQNKKVNLGKVKCIKNDLRQRRFT